MPSDKSSLVDYLSVSNTDGQTVGVWWGRVASLIAGSWLLSIVIGISTIVDAATDAVVEISSAAGGWYSAYLGAIISVPSQAFEGAFEGAQSFLDPLGILGGPLGIAIALLSLYLWVTIE